MWLSRYLIIKFLEESLEEYLSNSMVGRNDRIKPKNSVQLKFFLSYKGNIISGELVLASPPIHVSDKALFTYSRNVSVD